MDIDQFYKLLKDMEYSPVVAEGTMELYNNGSKWIGLMGDEVFATNTVDNIEKESILEICGTQVEVLGAIIDSETDNVTFYPAKYANQPGIVSNILYTFGVDNITYDDYTEWLNGVFDGNPILIQPDRTYNNLIVSVPAHTLKTARLVATLSRIYRVLVLDWDDVEIEEHLIN